MRESHAKCVRLGRSDNAGLFKGIWSDMAIETTFMRYGHGHGQSGVIGITMRPETLKTWAYSLHACNTVVINLDQKRTQEQHVPAYQTHPKEEAKARVETLHKCVTTMAAIAQRQGKVNNMKILGTEMIYARAMALQCSQRYYDTRNLMAHELASRPASMFDDSGAMKVAKTKAVLQNTLKVEMERRHADVDASFLDGCAVLWVVPWPTGGTVQDFLNNFRRHIQSHLDSSDIYLLFDRYKEGSIKDSTNNYRDQGASRVYSPNFLLRKLFLP